MARPSGLKRPCPPSRDGAGAAARGRNRPSHPPVAAVTVPVAADEYNHRADGEHPEEAMEELEIENDVDTTEDGINLGDGQHPIDVDAGNGAGGVEVDGSENTNAASSGSGNGKLTAACWDDFVPILDENDVRTHAICKRCGKRFAARASIGTGSLNRHMAACRKKQDNDRRVQSRLSMSANGLHNWVYDAARTRNELCRLIARLDLPLGVGDTQAWEDYIKNAHNPTFEKVSR